MLKTERINDQQILAALIASGSIRAAAKNAGVAESTIRNRLNDPGFREMYDKAKGEILTEACDALSARLTLAVDGLSSILEDAESPATAKISAADSVLRHGLRYIEAANILRRLDALEAAQEENEQ